MSAILAGGTAREVFEASPGRATGRIHTWIWPGMLFSIVLLVALVWALEWRFDSPELIAVAVALVGVDGLLWWSVRRTSRSGQPLVVIDERGIESPLFRGPERRIPWGDVVGAAFHESGPRRELELRLREREGRRDRRSLWTGVNPTLARLRMSAFDVDTQMRLLEAIEERIAEQTSVLRHDIRGLVASLGEECASQTRL